MRTHQTDSLPASSNFVFRRFRYPHLSRALAQVNWQAILSGAGLFALFITLLAAIQFATPNLVGNDGYYHIKLAQLMRQQGLRSPFPWLPLTILNAGAFVDHHFLFHILLMPFTGGDLRQGAKWASVILPAFAFLAGWWLLRQQRVPYAALWSVGFLTVSEAFLYRMSMPRAQAVSLLMLFLALHLTLTRRYRWLLPLAFLYVWLYDAFPLILMIVGVYVAARWLLERQLDLAPLGYAALGIGLGLVINPYFPDNLVFIFHHLLPKFTNATATRVGREWYPYETWTLIENSGPALLAFVAGAFALGLREQRMNARTATTFVLAVLFGLMLFKSRRFVEYFPPFALIFAAFAWAPFIQRRVGDGGWPINFDQPLDQAINRWHRLTGGSIWRRRVLAGLLGVALLPALWFNVQAARASLQDSKPYQRYADAAAWLQAYTPAGSRVFQTDWDDFTRLYFYNTHNTYTLGLDPTYMQLYDANLYDLWVDVSQGRIEAPAQTIAETFGARYALTDLNHKGFLREAKADPRLEEVYHDEYAVIFRVLTPGEE